ncbi:helix-turn-helix domain-containing protein [Fructilactobacillus hinvesii]|uniref:Helix-turn-helix domain-containing protein n=1 Tax=Fructilactobacillus hinvesii TaxID=2940300 RepID=A0ABY5BRH8_9LACO|nr:helix-turn-helix transcriptional regulator [Fructilactobacillus hinvesii]USS87729.1 helix-turn-helix domain-containing protein [Fructilactobacillus hinvesii]
MFKIAKDKNQKLEIGKRIKAIRISLGLDQPQFAEKVEPIAKPSNVSRWENGINTPNAKRLKSIAKLGNVSVDYLLNGKSKNKLSKDNMGEALNEIKAIHLSKNDKLKEALDIVFTEENVERYTDDQSTIVFSFLKFLTTSFSLEKKDDFNDLYAINTNFSILIDEFTEMLENKKKDETAKISKEQAAELSDTVENLENSIDNFNSSLDE